MIFTPPERPTDMLKLPSGDWIRIEDIDAGRVKEGADRKTGLVGGTTYVCAGGSWFAIPFESADDAHAFLDALMIHRNDLVAERHTRAALTRLDARELISQVASR